uniref:Uncharacterized protein n=1 Tax=Anguilla anguilla TaxID=7936 RepID=A0A0E9W3E3_ANGAN
MVVVCTPRIMDGRVSTSQVKPKLMRGLSAVNNYRLYLAKGTLQ